MYKAEKEEDEDDFKFASETNLAKLYHIYV